MPNFNKYECPHPQLNDFPWPLQQQEFFEYIYNKI